MRSHSKGWRRSVDRGTCRLVLSRDIMTLLRKQQALQGADALEISGRQHWVHRRRKVHLAPARSKTPSSMEPSCAGTGTSHVCLQRREVQTASGSRKAHADDGQTWEVGQLHSTVEVA